MNMKNHPMKSGLRALLGALAVAALVFASCSSPSGGSDDPAVETPVVETPVTETPVTETPVTEIPVKSSVCTLSALTVSAGTLVPAFDPAVTSYTVDVESSVKSLTVTSTAADAKATVSESGAAARTLALGETAIVLTVTAEDGTAKAYTVTAFRKPVVYAAGWYLDGSEYNQCYWKGSERIDLPYPDASTERTATGIALSGGSVYVSGYYQDDSAFVACYWKDGVRVDIATGTSRKAHDIAVVDGTVYLAGEFGISASGYSYSHPCYWKEGIDSTMVELDYPDDDRWSYPLSIAIADGDVYMGGLCNRDVNDVSPCFWKGTTLTEYPDDTLAYGIVGDIAIANDSVYLAAGYTNYMSSSNTASILKDGVRTDFPVSGATYVRMAAVAIDSGAVYGAGIWRDANGKDKPCFWKDGVRTDLMDETQIGYVNDVAVLDGRTYAAGGSSGSDDYDGFAVYWEGTTRHDLSTQVSGTYAIALGE